MEIQASVETGIIRFGIAIEIARIIEEDGEGPEVWRYWLDKALLQPITVPDFRFLVNEHIKIKRSGQQSLFAIMGEKQESQLKLQNRRLVVQAEFLKAIHAFIGYFGKVENLYEEGRLGKEDSPFSDRSPIRLFRKLVDRLQGIIPFMRSGLPSITYKQIEGHLFEMQLLLNLLEGSLDEEQERIV